MLSIPAGSSFSFYDPFLGLPGQPWQAANIPRGDHERHGSIPSWPGLTRPSIIPSKGACEALDARIKSGHDEFARVSTSRSRGALRPSFSKFETAQKQRAQGMPGVWLARSLACKQRKHTSKVTTGSPQRSGIPCTIGFNGCFVLSLVIGLSCHHPRRNAQALSPR